MLDLDEDIGIPSAPVGLRLKYIASEIEWARELVKKGAHLPHIRLLLRRAIYYQWERPLMRNYAASQCWSLKAVRYKGVTRRDRRRDLRFDHAIPLNIIVNKLLEDEDVPLDKFLKRNVRGTVITLDEDLSLTRAGLQSKMPPDWTWEEGCINARYQAVGIKIYSNG